MKAIFSKADIILFVLLIVIAAGGIVLLSGSGQGETAVIRQNGEVVLEVPLAIDKTYTVGSVMLEVKDGAIRFAESDCPGQECVHAGWLSSPGDTMACLPNHVSVTVSGESEVDAIAK